MYSEAEEMFLDSGCKFQSDPQLTTQGPFCASDCQEGLVASDPAPPSEPSDSTDPSVEQQAGQSSDTPSDAAAVETESSASLRWKNWSVIVLSCGVTFGWNWSMLM